MIVRYEIEEEYVTRCPYYVKNTYGYIRVGSEECMACEHFGKKVTGRMQFVDCHYPAEVYE